MSPPPPPSGDPELLSKTLEGRREMQRSPMKRTTTPEARHGGPHTMKRFLRFLRPTYRSLAYLVSGLLSSAPSLGSERGACAEEWA